MPNNGMEPSILVPQASSRNLSSSDLRKATHVPKGKIFHSGSKYLVRWKTLLLMLVAYDAFILPVEWVFLQLDRRTHFVLYIGLFIDLMFFLDIFVHLNTARLINGSWVTNRALLTKRYLRSWFVIDVIAAIPFDLFFHVHLRWLKIVRIFSLLRVVKFSKMAHNIQANFKLSASVYRVIRFVVMVVFGIHWCACIFGFLNKNKGSNDHSFSGGIDDFVNSLLWSTSTIIPVGYGHDDFRAITFGARLFGIAVMALGAGIFTFAITKGVGLVQQLSDIEQRRFESKMDQVEELLDHLNVPDDLWDEITCFFQYHHKTRTPALCNEQSLIDDLSRQLRSDVISAVNEYETSDAFILDCVFAMQIFCFPPNDDLSEFMEGYLCVVIEGSLMFKNRIIGPGARFGRLSHPHRQDNTKKNGPMSRTWCRISVLKRDALIHVLSKHREVQRYLCGKGGLRLRPAANKPGQAAWVNEVVNYLSQAQCQSISLMVDGLRLRLQHQENLIRGVDRIFAVDIARRPSAVPRSPSERAAAFTLDAFSTPSVRASSGSLALSSDLDSFRLDARN